MLVTNGFPAPIARIAQTSEASHVIWTEKEAPGLTYSAQVRTNLETNWLNAETTVSETSTRWSVVVSNAPDVDARFFRIAARPAADESPPPEP
jgi:hypothetical protein